MALIFSVLTNLIWTMIEKKNSMTPVEFGMDLQSSLSSFVRVE